MVRVVLSEAAFLDFSGFLLLFCLFCEFIDSLLNMRGTDDSVPLPLVNFFQDAFRYSDLILDRQLLQAFDCLL